MIALLDASHGRRKAGFSLLEIIIATAILAASGVMLMSMFSTADRHARRAEKRAIAQMLCESKVDELLAAPDTILPIENDVFPQYPGWVYSVALEATTLEMFVQLDVQVRHMTGQPLGAKLELVTTDDTNASSTISVDSLPQEPTYRIRRWLEFEGDLATLGMGSSEGRDAMNSEASGFSSRRSVE